VAITPGADVTREVTWNDQPPHLNLHISKDSERRACGCSTRYSSHRRNVDTCGELVIYWTVTVI
jgi:hypothetical protein